jgi:hypothetical protein
MTLAQWCVVAGGIIKRKDIIGWVGNAYQNQRAKRVSGTSINIGMLAREGWILIQEPGSLAGRFCGPNTSQGVAF